MAEKGSISCEVILGVVASVFTTLDAHHSGLDAHRWASRGDRREMQSINLRQLLSDASRPASDRQLVQYPASYRLREVDRTWRHLLGEHIAKAGTLARSVGG